MHWYISVSAIAIAIALTLIHFLGEKISERLHKFHIPLESLGAGLMVGIIFLELLPHISAAEEHLAHYIYIPFLLGFTLIAIIEKIVYKGFIHKGRKKIASKTNTEKVESLEKIEEDGNDLQEINKVRIEDFECISPDQNALFESIALVSHGFVVGLLISFIFDSFWEIAFILMIPFFIRAFTISFSAEQIMEVVNPKPRKILKILSLITPTFGAIVGVLIFEFSSEIIFFIIFAVFLGLLLYIVIRDMIPLGKKGKPLMFLLGVSFAIGLFLIFELLIE